ncbi:MAG: radical SAM protein [Bacilli bacterium]
MSLNSIAIDITYKCNFRCRHCYNQSGEHTNEKCEVADVELLKMIEQFANEKPVSLCICGGETLLRKELLYKIGKLVKGITGSTTSLNMVTNGFLMNDEVANKLKESGFDLIQVSLDGATPYSHNWLRDNTESFDRAINAIKLLVKRDFNVGVACAPTKVNREEFVDTAKLCKDLGVKLFRVQPLMIMGRGNNLKEKLLTSTEYYKLSQKLMELRLDTEQFGQMLLEWGDPIQHLEFIKRKSEVAKDISVNAYGEIMVSPYIPLIVGDLKKHTLKEYLERGLLEEVYNLPVIKKMAGLITSWEEMDLHNKYSIIPAVGSDKYIYYDLIDESARDYELIEKIMDL